MSARVFDPRPCELGEGPLWHPRAGAAFLVRYPRQTLLTEGQDWVFNRHVSAAGWLGQGALLIATETDLMRFDPATGAQESIAPLEADNPVTRSNDGRADPWGGFWIGTMGKRAEPGAGAIYRYYRGEVRQLSTPITIPNAISFPPDGGHAHFADTAKSTVWRQRLSDKDGWPMGEPEVFLDHGQTAPTPMARSSIWMGISGAPSGDRRGCAATPDGRVLQEVTLPVSQPSCPAFGGAELRDLYITTAREHMSAAALAANRSPGRSSSPRTWRKARQNTRSSCETHARHLLLPRTLARGRLGADAARMAGIGLTWVRIGEFAWSRLEPRPGDLRFDWLDRAIDVLGSGGAEGRAWHPHGDAAALDAGQAPRHAGRRCRGAPARLRLAPALLFQP